MKAILLFIASLVALPVFALDSYFFTAEGQLPSKLSISGDELDIKVKITRTAAPKATSIVAYHQGLGPGHDYQIQVNLADKPKDDWVPMMKLGEDIFFEGISVTRAQGSGIVSSFSLEGSDPEKIRSWVSALAGLLEVPADHVHVDLKKVGPAGATKESSPVRLEKNPASPATPGPLALQIPAGWKVDHQTPGGLHFYTVTAGPAGGALLMFSQWPPGGEPEDIPGLVQKLAEGFLEQAKQSSKFALAPPEYRISKFSGSECQGSYAVFRISEGGIHQSATMFMMSVDGKLWSGQFNGPSNAWNQALGVLKSVKKAD